METVAMVVAFPAYCALTLVSLAVGAKVATALVGNAQELQDKKE